MVLEIEKYQLPKSTYMKTTYYIKINCTLVIFYLFINNLLGQGVTSAGMTGLVTDDLEEPYQVQQFKQFMSLQEHPIR